MQLPVHRYTKKAARRDHMIFWSFFRKIFQRCQSSLTHLNLIENDQRFIRYCCCMEIFLQNPDHRIRMNIRLKKTADCPVSFEINIYRVFKLVRPKFLHRICLSNLTRPIQKQGHPVLYLKTPFLQIFHDLPAHFSCTS